MLTEELNDFKLATQQAANILFNLEQDGGPGKDIAPAQRAIFKELRLRLDAGLKLLTTPSEPPAEQAKERKCPHDGNPNCTWNPFLTPPRKSGACLIECPVASTPTTPPPGQVGRDGLAKWYFGFAFKNEPETWEYFQPHEWGEYEAADDCYRFADTLIAALPGIGGQQARQWRPIDDDAKTGDVVVLNFQGNAVAAYWSRAKKSYGGSAKFPWVTLDPTNCTNGLTEVAVSEYMPLPAPSATPAGAEKEVGS